VASSREARLRALVDKFAPQVGAYLRRRAYPLNDADVEELIQAVYVVAWRRLDDIPLGAECAWLIGVARNVLNNERRGHSRRRNLQGRLTPRRDEPSAEDHAIANEQLRIALGALSDSDRELLLLHFWDGLKATEIAHVMGIRPGAAATRLSRASARLRANFEAPADGAVKANVE
jgi:RNA polymerase sigma factor (sigma-70 family)